MEAAGGTARHEDDEGRHWRPGNGACVREGEKEATAARDGRNSCASDAGITQQSAGQARERGTAKAENVVPVRALDASRR